MVKKVAYLSKMPDGLPYVRREKVYGTIFRQNHSSGLMTGRKNVKGYGDRTGIKRVKQDFILVKGSSGRRGTIRKRYEDGMITGRF